MCADKFIEVSFRSEENERKCIANSLIRRDTHYAFVCVCVCWFQWKWWHKNIDGFILRSAVISSLALDSARRNLSASNTRNISIDSFIAIRAKVLEAAPATHTKKRKNTERMEHKSMIKTTRIFIACRKKNYFRTKSLVNAYRRRMEMYNIGCKSDGWRNDEWYVKRLACKFCPPCVFRFYNLHRNRNVYAS